MVENVETCTWNIEVDHLSNLSGVVHADGYGGYKKLYGNQIVEAACMAHVRRNSMM